MRRYELMRPLSILNGLDKEFNDFFSTQVSDTKWKPLSRVVEKDSHYHLALDIPGVNKEYLTVELNENILSVSGERKDKFSQGDSKLDHGMKFDQKFSLPKDSNLSEIEVNQDNGVLDIIIPKTKKNAVKKSLDIQSGNSNFLGKFL